MHTPQPPTNQPLPSGFRAGLSIDIDFEGVFKMSLDAGVQIFCANKTAVVYRSFAQQMDVKVEKKNRPDFYTEDVDQVLDYAGLFENNLVDKRCKLSTPA